MFLPNSIATEGSNEVYGIRDHSAGIWDHKPWDRDQ